MTTSPVSVVTPENAPRDAKAIEALGRFRVNGLARHLGLNTTDKTATAWEALVWPDGKCGAVLDALNAWDREHGGPAKAPAAAAPAPAAPVATPAAAAPPLPSAVTAPPVATAPAADPPAGRRTRTPKAPVTAAQVQAGHETPSLPPATGAALIDEMRNRMVALESMLGRVLENQARIMEGVGNVDAKYSQMTTRMANIESATDEIANVTKAVIGCQIAFAEAMFEGQPLKDTLTGAMDLGDEAVKQINESFQK